MAKLFADRLQILESKLNEIHSTESLRGCHLKVESIDERLKQVEQKLLALDAKITQIVNEITPIITSHANALNALLGNNHLSK